MIDENTPRCGARLRRNTEKICRRLACISADGSYGRCKLHAGKSPRGTASPNFKTGLHSKVLTGAKLQKRFKDWLSDRQDNHQARAILQFLIDHDISQLQDNAQMWREARHTFAELKRLLSSENALENRAVEINAVMAELEVSLQGGKDTEARAKLPDLLDLQTKILERTVREEVAAKQMITMEEFLIATAKTRDIIARFVPEDQRAEFEAVSVKLLAMSTNCHAGVTK